MPHPSLKYWQKMYLATLALFLVSLFGGLFAVLNISLDASFEARRDEFLARQHTLAQYLAGDMAAVLANRPDALGDLLAVQGARAKREGLRIAVWQDEKLLYSALPTVPGGMDELKTLTPGQRSWQVRVLGGRHIIFATTALAGDLGGYRVAASSDMEDFYSQWQGIAAVFGLLCGGVSVFFAAALYLMLRRMNRPLQALTATAHTLAAGDYTARALPPGRPPRRDEVGELARTLDDLAGKVTAQLAELTAEAETKQRLVDDLSHEMRTPLTAIGGYAEYIRRADLHGEELVDATETIEFESRRLLNLSNQLLWLAVLRDTPPERSPVPLCALMQRAYRAALPAAQRRGVNLRLQLPPQDGTLLGDADLLESLLVNLCDNGVKACAQGGEVTLGAALEPDAAVLCVTDTGCGMSEETLAHLGQPFYRADKGRSRAEGGAGLGVALCMAIVAAHGAALRYESKPGQGTVAKVRFARGDCAPPGV